MKEGLWEFGIVIAALLLILPVSIHVGIYKLVMRADKQWQRLLGMNYPPAEMY